MSSLRFLCHLSGEGCPSGSVGSPFGSDSVPLPLSGAPRGRSSWRCRLLTVAFPWVCKCGGGQRSGQGYEVSQDGAPLGSWIGQDLHWDWGRGAGLGPRGLKEPLAQPTLRPAPFLSLIWSGELMDACGTSPWDPSRGPSSWFGRPTLVSRKKCQN